MNDYKLYVVVMKNVWYIYAKSLQFALISFSRRDEITNLKFIDNDNVLYTVTEWETYPYTYYEFIHRRVSRFTVEYNISYLPINYIKTFTIDVKKMCKKNSDIKINNFEILGLYVVIQRNDYRDNCIMINNPFVDKMKKVDAYIDVIIKN